MPKMRVLHIVPTISRASGGPARSTQGLVAALREVGVDAWLLSMTPGERPWLTGFDCSAFLCADSQGYFAWKRVVRNVIDKIHPDLLHLHQIWTPDLHAATVVARACGIPSRARSSRASSTPPTRSSPEGAAKRFQTKRNSR